MGNNATTPGKHPDLNLKFFGEDDIYVVERLSKEWYVTRSGIVKVGQKAEYKYVLIKPTEKYSELFNFELEIIACLSSYESFEPRVLDAYGEIYNNISNYRLEKSITVLISKDNNVISKLSDLLRKDQEYQVIVPFSYQELLTYRDEFFMRNRFKQFFYSRDLFSFQNPLTKEFYFFGRKDLIHNIVDKHNTNENSGLFGLRKTGKTSIVFGIQRVLKNSGQYSAYIDCQNPYFHKARWNKALWIIIDTIKKENNIPCKTHVEEDYLEDKAASYFAKDIININKKLKGKKILIIFDEIEHITYGVSPSSHWKTGSDFLFFWQTMRSIFQTHKEIFTYLIVGTNPKCVEISSINGTDNPIFSQISSQYIPSFEVSQTKEMVNKLGGIMGLKFDEIIYAKLTEDFGGHPFLMRLVCSHIHKIVESERPARIDKSIYEKAKQLFETHNGSYIEMVINVLNDYYHDEYEMLTFLAVGNTALFNEYATMSDEYTSHLLGYSILDKNNQIYTFKIEAIKHYLEKKNKYTKIGLSNQEKLKEISERRNYIEPKLREIIRVVMKAKYGEVEAVQRVIDVLRTKNQLQKSSLKDVLNPNKNLIFFEDLRKIILKNWSDFENVFGKNQESFKKCMETINNCRADAHAKNITDEEMNSFRLSASKIETYIKEYLE